MPTRRATHPNSTFAQDQRWRYCVLRTVRDLHLSVARRRTLNLPNLHRLFDLRWGKVKAATARVEQGRRLAHDFLEHYYLQYQPFRTPPLPRCASPANPRPH